MGGGARSSSFSGPFSERFTALLATDSQGKGTSNYRRAPHLYLPDQLLQRDHTESLSRLSNYKAGDDF